MNLDQFVPMPFVALTAAVMCLIIFNIQPNEAAEIAVPLKSPFGAKSHQINQNNNDEISSTINSEIEDSNLSMLNSKRLITKNNVDEKTLMITNQNPIDIAASQFTKKKRIRIRRDIPNIPNPINYKSMFDSPSTSSEFSMGHNFPHWNKVVSKLFTDIELIQNELSQLKQTLAEMPRPQSLVDQSATRSIPQSKSFNFGCPFHGDKPAQFHGPSPEHSRLHHHQHQQQHHHHYYFYPVPIPMLPMTFDSPSRVPPNFSPPQTHFGSNSLLLPGAPFSSVQTPNTGNYFHPHHPIYQTTTPPTSEPRYFLQSSPMSRSPPPYTPHSFPTIQIDQIPSKDRNVASISTQTIETVTTEATLGNNPSTATTSTATNQTNFELNQIQNQSSIGNVDSSDIWTTTPVPLLSSSNVTTVIEKRKEEGSFTDNVTGNGLLLLNDSNFVMASCELIANRHIALLNQQDISGDIRMWQQRHGNGSLESDEFPVYMQIRLKGFKVFEDEDDNRPTSQSSTDNQIEFYNNDPAAGMRDGTSENLIRQSEIPSVEFNSDNKKLSKRQNLDGGPENRPTTLSELETNFVTSSFNVMDISNNQTNNNESGQWTQPIQAQKSHKNQYLFGMHVHELSDFSRDCQSTGNHYNPFNVSHGGPTDPVRHVGDLGNVLCNPRGEVNLNLKFDRLSLLGKHGIINRSIVIRNQADDYGKNRKNKPNLTTGNYGARIACCVIRQIVDHGNDQDADHDDIDQNRTVQTNLTTFKLAE